MSGSRREEIMTEKAGSRPYLASTNPSPARCPAYPCNWVLHVRGHGETMIRVVREWDNGLQLRLERRVRAKLA
jgi:hypothetical protein